MSKIVQNATLLAKRLLDFVIQSHENDNSAENIAYRLEHRWACEFKLQPENREDKNEWLVGTLIDELRNIGWMIRECDKSDLHPKAWPGTRLFELVRNETICRVRLLFLMMDDEWTRTIVFAPAFLPDGRQRKSGEAASASPEGLTRLETEIDRILKEKIGVTNPRWISRHRRES